MRSVDVDGLEQCRERADLNNLEDCMVTTHMSLAKYPPLGRQNVK
jgi:hypothetical protein